MAASLDGAKAVAPLEPRPSSTPHRSSTGRYFSRRWKWLLRGLLVVACCYLLKPTRSWLDQWIAARFDPYLSVHALRWHSNPLVLEMQQVDWQPAGSKHGVSASVEKGWFAIDAEPLLDARFIAPKVVLQDVRFTLDSKLATPQPLLRVWQEEMAEKFAELDWQNLPLRFESALGREGEGENWQLRIASWLARSTAMANRADEQQRAALSVDNPLRIESQQQRVLGELNKLTNEHSQLQQQFELLTQLLQAKIKQVDDQLARELAELDGIVEKRSVDDAYLQSLAHAMAQATATNTWHELEDYIRLCDALCQSQWGPQDAAGTNHYRQGPWIECWDIVATACIQPLAIEHFQLSGSYRRGQRQQEPIQPRSNWQVDFNSLQPTRLLASNRADCRQATDLQMFSYSSDQLLAGTGETPMNRLVMVSEGEHIEGEFVLLASDWQPLLSVAGEHHLPLELSGTWDGVQFTIAEPLPSWLIDAVRGAAQEELRQEQQLIGDQLRSVAARRRDELLRLVTAVEKAQTAGRQDYERIASCEKSLRAFFADMDREYEFARRPAGTTR